MSSHRTDWSDRKMRKFVKLYKLHPNLWDRQHPDFAKHDPRSNSHRKISKKLHVSEPELIARIQRIRVKFQQYLKKREANPKARITWKFFEKLKFLKKYFRVEGESPPSSECESSDDSDSDKDENDGGKDASPATAATSSARIEDFFMAVTSMANGLSRKQIAELQVKIMSWISEMQLASITEEAAWESNHLHFFHFLYNKMLFRIRPVSSSRIESYYWFNDCPALPNRLFKEIWKKMWIDQLSEIKRNHAIWIMSVIHANAFSVLSDLQM